MRTKIARIAAWLVTAGILAYLFTHVPVKAVMQAVTQAAAWTAPVLAGIVLVVYVADCCAVWKTFGWFVAPLSFRETMTIRGATYLLALVNYSLGQGAFVYFLNRTRGVPAIRATAGVLLIMGINLLLLLFLTTTGIALGADTSPALRTLVKVAYAGLAFYVVLLVWRPAALVKRPLFDVLLTAGPTGYLKSLAVRLPHVMTLLLLNHVSLHAFGVQVPVLQTLLCTPVVLLIAVIPISALGLGPVQGAMILFFSRYAPGDEAHRQAAVLAASLGAQGISWCVQIAIGLVCVRSQLVQTLKEPPKEFQPAS